MGKPKAPAPPDPVQTAAASTSTNVNTAVANAILQNMRKVGPEGTQAFDVTGTYSWVDPYTDKTLSIPTFTSTTSLNPTAQRTFEIGQEAQENLATISRDQSQRLVPYLSDSVDLGAGAIDARGLGKIDLSTAPGVDTSKDAIFGQLGDQFAFAGLPSVDKLTLGNEAVEERLFDLGSARLDYRFGRDEDRLRQRLADQGIQEGSTAFSNAIKDFGQTKNDAYGQLMLTGRSLASGELKDEFGADMALRGQLTNEQLAGRGRAMSDRAQAFGEITGGTSAGIASRAQYANEILGANAANIGNRQQAIQELLTKRNQPLNEISALTSGSQVAMPNFGQPNIGAIPTTDVAGLINADYANRLGAAKFDAQNNPWNSVGGGLFKLGSSALMSPYLF